MAPRPARAAERPTAASAAPRHDGRPRYAPPVDAPVRDPFRPPPAPWLPGNRGIEYATVPGTRVHAIGPGVVLVAGPVAGRLVLTVRHPDGLRSSYVGLAALRVEVGDVVAGGDVVAVAGPALHVGVRRGRTYLDPAALWGRAVGRGHVVLVPLDGGPSAAAARGRAVGRSVAATGDLAARVVADLLALGCGGRGR